MKLLLTLVSTALAIASISGSVSAAVVPSTKTGGVKAKGFAAFKLGDQNSCEVQINFQRRIDDTTTDYKIYSVDTGKEIEDQIPYDPSRQPITVVTPSGHGQQGAYPVPGDEGYSYTPFQIDFCGPKKGQRFTTYYITGTDTNTGVVTKYETFSLKKPYIFALDGGPSLSDKVPLVKGTNATYQATWSYKPQGGLKVKGYYLFFGDKWGHSYDNGDVFPSLGSIYFDGATTTTGQFTLKKGMDAKRVVVAVSVLSTDGALLSPTNAMEVWLIP